MNNLSRHADLVWVGNLVADKGIQISEMSKLGWIIGLVQHATWAETLYFFCLEILSVPNVLASFRLLHPHRHFGLILIFYETIFGIVSIYLYFVFPVFSYRAHISGETEWKKQKNIRHSPQT